MSWTKGNVGHLSKSSAPESPKVSWEENASGGPVLKNRRIEALRGAPILPAGSRAARAGGRLGLAERSPLSAESPCERRRG